MSGKFEHFKIQKISRTENTQADALSKLASALISQEKSKFVEVLDKPSFEIEETLQLSDEGNNWMTDIKNFMAGLYVPSNPKEVVKLNCMKARYKLEDGILFKRSFYRPLLRCLNPEEAMEAIRRLHEGDGVGHIGGHAMVIQLMRQGFFWPTMRANAIEFAKKCEKCQKHGDSILQPTRKLSSMVVAWPFAQWRLDIVDPLPKAPGQIKFLIVAIEYFSKWVEAEPLVKITIEKVKQFI